MPHTSPLRLFPALASLLLAACTLTPVLAAEVAVQPAAGKAVALFNGRDLTGWVAVGKEKAPSAQQTWTVRDGVLHASGAPYGYLRTQASHSDYSLRVEWRWVPGPAPTDSAGKPRNRNSGVLLHLQPEERFWPVCLEAQLSEGNAGDLIAMSTAVTFAELLVSREKALAAAGTDEAARQQSQVLRRVPRQLPSAEKPVGEWNVYEITCRGDSVALRVNGVLLNTATRLNISAGPIALQSEGAQVEFRNVVLTPLAP